MLAAGLLAGSPAAGIVRRIKLAALLGDVLIEDGTYRVNAGPDGAFSGWSPSAGDERWQSPKERSLSRRSGFYVAIGDQHATELLKMTIMSDTTISWNATYSPVKRELPNGFGWIKFGHYELSSEEDKSAKKLLVADKKAGVLKGEHNFVRNRLLDHASLDRVVASALDAVLATDATHAAVISSRVKRGTANLVRSFEAANVLIPDVSVLDWSDIDELRQTPSWADLRVLWDEIGQLSLELCRGSADFDVLVHQQMSERLRDALESAEGPRGKKRWAGTLLDLAVGTLANTAGMDPLASTAASIGSAVIGELLDRSLAESLPRWVAADRLLSKRLNERILGARF